jgi:hypothetical protein
MVVMQTPQFPAQNDHGEGDGVASIPQWYDATMLSRDTITPLVNLNLDPEVGEVASRLRFLLNNPRHLNLSTTDLHDLTCFVLHRLIRPLHSNHDDGSCDRIISECVRHATVLYMLIIHGPAYFSHAELQHTTTTRLKSYLERLPPSLLWQNSSLSLWIFSVGMVASVGSSGCIWFMGQAQRAAEELGIFSWEQALSHLRGILWLENKQAETAFKRKWDEAWATTNT